MSDQYIKKPILIIIAGPNGSGKTSITNKILKHEWLKDCVYINSDNIAKEVFANWNSRDAILHAANYATAIRNNCLTDNKSFIFESVLSVNDKIEFNKKAKL